MSFEYKLRWLLFVVLFGLIWWLVAVSFVRNDAIHNSKIKNDSRGLECVYNCEYFDEVIK